MNIRSQLLISLTVLLCGASSGCAFFSAPDPLPRARVYSPVEQFILARTPGSPDAVGMVSDPEYGDNLRIVLEQEYLSAAGETCRRASLFSPRGEAEVIVMCRDASGLWVTAPRVWGMGLPPVTPSAGLPGGAQERRETEGASPATSSPAI